MFRSGICVTPFAFRGIILALLRVETAEQIAGGVNIAQVQSPGIAATNADLGVAVTEGRFRQDLLFRLNTIEIRLPPLRDRREDIPLLVDNFLEKYNREANRQVTQVPREVLDALLAHSWPGNVRELENCIERAVVMSPDNTVSLDLIPEEIREGRPDFLSNPDAEKVADPQSELRQAVVRFLVSRNDSSGIRDALLELVEETLLRYLLDSGQYSQRELADLLALSRVTLRKKLTRYNLL